MSRHLDAALEALEVGCQTADCESYVPVNSPECLRCGEDMGDDPDEDWCATCKPDVIAGREVAPSVELMTMIEGMTRPSAREAALLARMEQRAIERYVVTRFDEALGRPDWGHELAEGLAVVSADLHREIHGIDGS